MQQDGPSGSQPKEIDETFIGSPDCSLESRPEILGRLRAKCSTGVEDDEKVMNFKVQELRLLLEEALIEEEMHLKCFKADKALTFLECLRLATLHSKVEGEYQSAVSHSDSLYQVIASSKSKILNYDPERKEPESNEPELIDLIILTEVVSFSLLAMSLYTPKTDDQNEELVDSVDQLISKMSDLTVSPKFLEQNKVVSKLLSSRSEGGLILSMQDLICDALESHKVVSKISRQRATSVFLSAEAILARAISLPCQNFNSLAQKLLVKLVKNTGQSYHKKLLEMILQYLEALYTERKAGGQENFKMKVAQKLSNILALLFYKVDDALKIELINHIKRLFMEGNAKNEMVYVIFQSIDGAALRIKGNRKWGLQKAITSLVEIILEKLVEFLGKHRDDIEKASSIKFIVLLLKPLEELIQIVGPMSDMLPQCYREKIHSVFYQLEKKMLPLKAPPAGKVPYSLLDSYFNLSLLMDKDFQQPGGKIQFDLYYKLLNIFELQIKKNEQNALIIAKLLRLFQHLELPQNTKDKEHFYRHLGSVIKHVLQIKEPYVFFKIFEAFMEFAAAIELDNLDFMVPQNRQIQNIISVVMQDQKVSDLPELAGYDPHFEERSLHEGVYAQAMKDYDLLSTLCKVPQKSYDTAHTSAHSVSDQEAGQRVDLFSDQQTAESPAATKPPAEVSDATPTEQGASDKPHPADESSAVPCINAEFERALVSIGEKLIEVEMDLRDDDDEEGGDPAKKYTPDEIKGIAVRLVADFKQSTAKMTKKEFKAFVSKNKHSF